MKNKKIISSTIVFVLMFTLVPVFNIIAPTQVSGTEIVPISGTEIVPTSENMTFLNLMAAVQGETNAAAAYRAFAERAVADGYPVIARLFGATADAEAKHADDEWAVLVGMGATVRPVAAVPVVGDTRANLLAAFGGETYEYTVMYPGFLETAQAEGNAGAVRIFRLAMKAEEVHAGNYLDVFTNLPDAGYVDAKYSLLYRCVVCGEVVTVRPGVCPICGASGASFVIYGNSEPINNDSEQIMITSLSWNNGNDGGINQFSINGITLKNNKNYVTPANFDAIVAKTTFDKTDNTEIYTVTKTTVTDNDGQYVKVYDIKVALCQDGAWKGYSGSITVDNPGGNNKNQQTDLARFF
ncbi:MAG: hypothetical protein LBQ98_02440 [Nitrososphaerota archaeon]|jgi:rubrerythrin|nr:hypothetical protein [Nitrososphaerota archaeon]